MRIIAEPLTQKAFAPYGEVLTAPDDFGRAYFDEGLRTSRSTAWPSLSVSRVRPLVRLPLEAKALERHEFSSQSFLPLDVSRWLVVVAPSAPHGGPDASSAVAFLAGPGHGVTYHAGTWHHPLTVLDRPARFAVVMWRDGTSTDEEFRTLATPILIDMGAAIWPPSPHTLGAPMLSRRRSSATLTSRGGEPMARAYDRDLIGYGPNPPDPKWPNGARLAVNFVMNYEEGSEPSVQDGEGYSETGLTEAHALNQGVKGRDLAAETMFEYGSRVGFWRLMRLFLERRLPLTIFGCALALERNPPAAAAIRKAGFDVCSHGWRWIKHYELSRATEREHIQRAIASFAKSVGERPLGWYCRYGPSVNTRELVVEEGGFLYDSDAYNDELPYWTTVKGRGHLVVPYSLTNNDGKYAGWTGTSDQWFSFVKDAFDMLHREGAHHPKMMSVGLHMRMIGHPARAAGLERLLDYMLKQDGVWITRRLDIARHWIATHPYPGQGLNEARAQRPARSAQKPSRR